MINANIFCKSFMLLFKYISSFKINLSLLLDRNIPLYYTAHNTDIICICQIKPSVTYVMYLQQCLSCSL